MEKIKYLWVALGIIVVWFLRWAWLPRHGAGLDDILMRDFDKEQLPAWAKRNNHVVRRSASDLAFRSRVFGAESKREQKRLREEARRWSIGLAAD